jgi:arylsulfatase A-like enzyme
VDRSLGIIVAELKARKLDQSTMIVLTAKHGQSPIDRKQRHVVDRNVIRSAVESVSPGLLAHASLDAIGLIWLKDSKQTEAVAASLRERSNEAGIMKVFHGEQLKLLLPAADGDPRMPDIVIQPQLGVFYADGLDTPATKALLAEHGGMLDEDTHVPLLVCYPGAKAESRRAPVFTHQIAPTILAALGLDPHALKAVQIEGTQGLPGLPW